MKTNPTLLLTLLATAALPGILPAQDPIPALSEEDLAARRQSVVNLKSHIEQRQERLQEVVDDIKRLDGRVESGVDQIVAMLEKVKDSTESRVRISTLKADVITGLRRTVDYYRNNRDALREQLRTGKSGLPAETLEKDIAIFDARIDKRIGQIAGIAKSFPDYQELEKYETTSRSSWYGWSWDNVEISEGWKQNRRDSREADSAREDFVKGMRDSLQYLQNRSAYLAEKLKEPSLTESEKSFYQSDLERNAALIQHRQQQIEEFLTGPGTGAAAQAVSQTRAHDLDLLVESARNDLREDFFAIFRKYAELNRARAELKSWQDNLAAREQWLADYDREHAKK